MKNQKSKQKATNVSKQVFVGTSQLNKLDIEELNQVSAGLNKGIIYPQS